MPATVSTLCVKSNRFKGKKGGVSFRKTSFTETKSRQGQLEIDGSGKEETGRTPMDGSSQGTKSAVPITLAGSLWLKLNVSLPNVSYIKGHVYTCAVCIRACTYFYWVIYLLLMFRLVLVLSLILRKQEILRHVGF